MKTTTKDHILRVKQYYDFLEEHSNDVTFHCQGSSKCCGLQEKKKNPKTSLRGKSETHFTTT